MKNKKLNLKTQNRKTASASVECGLAVILAIWLETSKKRKALQTDNRRTDGQTDYFLSLQNNGNRPYAADNQDIAPEFFPLRDNIFLANMKSSFFLDTELNSVFSTTYPMGTPGVAGPQQPLFVVTIDISQNNCVNGEERL